MDMNYSYIDLDIIRLTDSKDYTMRSISLLCSLGSTKDI